MKNQNEFNHYSLKTPSMSVLGTNVEEASTTEEVIKIAHMDYHIEKIQNYIHIDGEEVETPSFSIVRRDNNDILAANLLGKYEVLQNKELFKFLDKIVINENDITYNRAGVLGKGEVVFIVAKLPGYINIKGSGDVIDKYVIIGSSHNGSMGLDIRFVNIRPRGNNLMNFSVGLKNNKVNLRHTLNIANKLSKVPDIVGLQTLYNESFKNAIDRMADRQMTSSEIKEVVDGTFLTPGDLKLIKEGEKLSTRKQNTMDDIYQSLEKAPGQEDYRGSALWVLNGITSYFQNVKEYRNESRKMRGIMIDGEEHKLSQKAFNKLSYMS